MADNDTRPANGPGALPARNLEVGDEVARGGMGAVLRAKDLNIGRDVAIKIVLPGGDTSQGSLMRFVEEAQVTGQLEHPGIVPIYDLGTDENGQPFYTMKLVKGVTLKEVLTGIKDAKAEVIAKYPLAQLLTIFQKVCDAVAFAHSKGVIHRDLKPENVMIGEFGEVLVMDWGLAKLLGKAETASGRVGEVANLGLTMDGEVMGSPQFMAPEQAEGALDSIDERTDVFALGGILYNILALQSPFAGETVEEILAKVRRGEIQPVPDTAVLPHLPGGKVPESLAAVTLKAMKGARIDRYQSVKELQADIAAYQGGYATTAEQAGLWKQFALLVTRHKAVATAIAASMAVIVALTIGFTLKVVSERDRATQTLAELRRTAPTFAAQAKALVENQKFVEALDKIESAIKLDDSNADYHLFRANTLEALARLTEAAAAYRQVLTLRGDDAAAKVNLELCEKLLAENAGKTELTAPLKTKLLNALLAQNRQADAVPLSVELKRDTDTAETTITSRLKAIMALPGWDASRLTHQKDGTFKLDLNDLKVTDLTVLAGLPISYLDLSRCPVTDLKPLQQLPVLRALSLSQTPVTSLEELRGLNLRRLDINSTRVNDLSPVAGMPLVTMDAAGSGVKDLRPLSKSVSEVLMLSDTRITSLDGLQKLPLRELGIFRTGVEDLSPLRGSPVKVLWLNGCGRIRDLTPLLDCPQLETLSLPTHISDIAFLKRHPTLKRLSQQGIEYFKRNPSKVTPVAEFWQKNGDRLARQVPMEKQLEKFRQSLLAQGNEPGKVPRFSFDANGGLTVTLQGLKCPDISELRGVAVTEFRAYSQPLHDLSPLAGAPLRDFSLMGNTPVSDLSPLRDAPLEHFTMNKSGVRDISVLRGKPLRTVTLNGSSVEDVAPLADCPTLEAVVLPGRAKNIELLKRLPTLKYIGYNWDNARNRPDKTAAEFWKQFDANQKQRGAKR